MMAGSTPPPPGRITRPDPAAGLKPAENAAIFRERLPAGPVGVAPAGSSSRGQEGIPMLYAILCYNSEAEVNAWTKAQDDAVLAQRAKVTDKIAARGKLGPVARLMPTTAAVTVRAGREPLVIDGPFAETKEQLLGFYIVDCASLDEAIEAAKGMVDDIGSMEIRPLRVFRPGAPIKGHEDIKVPA
jgi:hypothetical protein